VNTKPGRVAIYARVSSDGQTTTNQVRELEAWAARVGHTVVATYIDQGISGAKGRDKRPQFDKLLKAATRREFDVAAAWSVDRLGRSLRDLIAFLEEIHASKVELYLHQQGLDTTSPAGKAMFQMLGIFAEFERSMIVARVNAGLARARKTGTKSGKPFGRPKVSSAVERKVLELRRQGMGMLKIARQVGCGGGTVQRIVAEQEA
jgi:DNA invertase Pin-like site-specific DNA recombinase